jgi:hypothetical protein
MHTRSRTLLSVALDKWEQNMAKTDIQRLNGAANLLANGLKRRKLPGLRIKTKITVDRKENDYGNGGWAVDVASWRGQPSIAISLDKYAYAPKRVFWVGFWSKESEAIKKLHENRPEIADCAFR